MRFPIIDTHCDTISECLNKGRSLAENSMHIDLRRMRKYPHYTQFFACFLDPVYREGALARCIAVIDKLYTEIERNAGRIALCRNYSDLIACREQRKTAAFLSLEGGESIQSLGVLRMLYQLGVRCIGLTWNYANHLAAGVFDPDSSRGLTAFGRQILAEMERLGILADVSHLNDKSFWDMTEVYHKPILATHSNARKVCPHPRNLTDAQFAAIRDSSGCVGINLYPLFLQEGGKAEIRDVIAHIEHFMALGGEDNIGIGADFDGVDALPRGIRGVEDVEKIFDELAKIGYPDSLLEKIAYKNFERVFKICL
mgnify:CR=1 FL=1